jgi:hypothetical protein
MVWVLDPQKYADALVHEQYLRRFSRHDEVTVVVLNQVEYVVLDEADRMLDIGFLPDLQRILSYLPKQRTTLLFSATFSPEIKRLAGSYLQNPVTIEVARPNETASTVEQRFYAAQDDDKWIIRPRRRGASKCHLDRVADSLDLALALVEPVR